MKKKKKNEYRDVVLYTSKFITYEDDGTVLIAEQERDLSKKQLEIDLSLIPNFLSGNKRYIDYKIDYFFKIKEGLISDEDEYEKVEKYNNVFFEIPNDNNDNATLVLTHDKFNSTWIVSLNNMNNFLDRFSFFVTKKYNPNFVYSSYDVKIDLKNKIEIKFKSVLENNFDDLSIFTVRKFSSYSLRKSNV